MGRGRGKEILVIVAEGLLWGLLKMLQEALQGKLKLKLKSMQQVA